MDYSQRGFLMSVLARELVVARDVTLNKIGRGAIGAHHEVGQPVTVEDNALVC